jgi:hypothetical protein
MEEESWNTPQTPRQASTIREQTVRRWWMRHRVGRPWKG